MLAVVSLLLIITLSLLITRIAGVALVHTGLSREIARFQARSAFSGVGFTTSEAESVVNHPVRRRIVLALMLVGNVGIVTAMSSLMLSFIDIGNGPSRLLTLTVLMVGVVVLWVAATSQWMDQHVCRWISWALQRYTAIEARDYARLLHLQGDYGVSELHIRSEDWLAGQTLGDTGLVREGLLVLGIECPGGHFIGAPGADVEIRAGDTLILYGRVPQIRELDTRRKGSPGDDFHQAAIAQYETLHERERMSAGR